MDTTEATLQQQWVLGLFWSNENVLKLIIVIQIPLKLCFKWVNYMVCRLYLNKVIFILKYLFIFFYLVVLGLSSEM